MGAFSRLLVVAIGGWYLNTQSSSTTTDYFVLISLAMVTYGTVTAATVYLGAWTRHLGKSSP
jgi:hypothetical protein